MTQVSISLSEGRVITPYLQRELRERVLYLCGSIHEETIQHIFSGILDDGDAVLVASAMMAMGSHIELVSLERGHTEYIDFNDLSGTIHRAIHHVTPGRIIISGEATASRFIARNPLEAHEAPKNPVAEPQGEQQRRLRLGRREL